MAVGCSPVQGVHSLTILSSPIGVINGFQVRNWEPSQLTKTDLTNLATGQVDLSNFPDMCPLNFTPRRQFRWKLTTCAPTDKSSCFIDFLTTQETIKRRVLYRCIASQRRFSQCAPIRLTITEFKTSISQRLPTQFRWMGKIIRVWFSPFDTRWPQRNYSDYLN